MLACGCRRSCRGGANYGEEFGEIEMKKFFIALFALGLCSVGLTKTLQPGHYISFALYQNLKTSMLDVRANPTKYNAYTVDVANKMYAALTAPGVQGVWIPFAWRDVEKTDGVYTWAPIDDNLAAARILNKRLILVASDKSFKDYNPMPDYFGTTYALKFTSARADSLSGYVSKRWDTYVSSRMTRLLKAVGVRYDADPNFEGVTTSESAIGGLPAGSGYTVEAYKTAIEQTVIAAKPYFAHSVLFVYLNFITGQQSYDIAKDARGEIVDKIMAAPGGGNWALGGPDVTADDVGHANSVNQFYIWAKAKYPSLIKASHAQFNDLRQLKSNNGRLTYFEGTGKYAPDVLRDVNLKGDYDLHPAGELGRYWTPLETFTYACENFGPSYMFWHYKTSVEAPDAAGHVAYTTVNALPVIAANPTSRCTLRLTPQAPRGVTVR